MPFDIAVLVPYLGGIASGAVALAGYRAFRVWIERNKSKTLSIIGSDGTKIDLRGYSHDELVAILKPVLQPLKHGEEVRPMNRASKELALAASSTQSAHLTSK